MKLHINSVSGWWYCQLTSWGSVWLGQGPSPEKAFKDYLQMVIDFDKEDDFDYDWCKSKGLIK